MPAWHGPHRSRGARAHGVGARELYRRRHGARPSAMAGHEVASSPPAVETLWEQSGGSGDAAVTALLDTIAGGKLVDEVRVLH